MAAEPYSTVWASLSKNRAVGISARVPSSGITSRLPSARIRAAAELEVREVTPDDLADLAARNAALDEAARQPAERRAARYRSEVDPLVVAWSSYVAEGATDKAADVAARIAAAKAQIREEISG